MASVADFSDTILAGTEKADRFNVSLEDRSTVAGITSDLTNPNNPLNKIWKELVPDKEASILADYQAKANVSYVEAMFTTERLENIGWNLFEEGIAASMTGITAQFNPTGFGSATIVSAVTDFMKDHIDYMKERVMLERNRDEALLENQKKKETHFNVFCLLCTSFVSDSVCLSCSSIVTNPTLWSRFSHCLSLGLP